jgi:hypothetical protein
LSDDLKMTPIASEAFKVVAEESHAKSDLNFGTLTKRKRSSVTEKKILLYDWIKEKSPQPHPQVLYAS